MPIKNNQGSDNIPLLRFPEFEGDWEKKKLGLIGEYIGGGTPDTSIQEYWEGNIPWISSSDIIENHIHNINIQKYITDEAIKNSATKKIPANSLIIVSRVGVGKFAINKMVVCTSQDFTNIVVNTKIFDPNFTAYNLYKNIDILYNISQGTSIKGFTTVDLKKSEISFPSLPEQTKIASFLTAVDEKIQALKKKHSLLEQYKKGVMQKLFSQELRFKDEDGNDFPEWEVKKLGEVCEIKKGEQLNKEELTETGSYPCLNGGINFSGYTEKYNSNENTITISEGGNSCGYVNFMTSKFWLGGHCYKVVLTNEILTNYFFQLLKFNERKIMDLRVGSGLPNIQQKDLRSFEISISNSIEEQTAIANFLSSLDEKINQTQMQIEKMEVWKKGLLQKMFC